MAESTVPDWLKDDGNDINPAKVHVDTELGTASSPASGSAELEPSTRTDDATTPGKCAQCFKWAMSGISLIFLILFVTSSAFQHNDAGGSAILWWIFYVGHAVLAAACLCLRCCKGVSCIEKPVVYLGYLLLVYSVALVVLSIIYLLDASESDAGPDAENFNDKEEKTFEVAGAGLGLASAIFHVSMWKYCSGKSKIADEEK